MEWRKIEVLRDEKWELTDGWDIQPGEIFRMFEEDGTPVLDRIGKETFKAMTTAIACQPEGNWSITAE